MDDRAFLEQQIQELREKLVRTERRLAAMRERSKLLQMQYEDARQREQNTTEIINELIERQRELNVMLNRANIMLNRAQEAMALTSVELNEMSKSLPEPKRAEWAERVAKITELFKKTGVQDAELKSLESSTGTAQESLNSSELKKESEQAFSKEKLIWELNGDREPARVEAYLVDEPASEKQQNCAAEAADSSVHQDSTVEAIDPQTLVFPPRRKSWWRRASGEG
ncbi:MAG: hypothetical protein ACUVRS_09680 [Armatimonadota bacterium]